MADVNGNRGDYECVEPALGDELGLLDDPDLSEDRRRRLEDHVMICDACRLRRAMARRVAADLAAGRLELPPIRGADRRRPRRRRTLAWGGGTALAAGLALMMLMAPRARDEGRIERSADRSFFLRPVEGEVVRGDRVRLAWQPIPGATSYRVTVSEVGGDRRWEGRTGSRAITLPDSAQLTARRNFRAFLEPVPADLARPGGVSVSFRRGSLREFLTYRLAAAPVVSRVLAAMGLVLMFVAIVPRPTRS